MADVVFSPVHFFIGGEVFHEALDKFPVMAIAVASFPRD